MISSFFVFSETYKGLYWDAKKRFEKSGILAPYVLLFTSKMQVNPGVQIIDLGKFYLPVCISSSSIGTTFDIAINSENDESRSRSFNAVKAFAETVEAKYFVCIGQVEIRSLEKPKVQEAIQFDFQSSDGLWASRAPISRKGKRVKLPFDPPPLQPIDPHLIFSHPMLYSPKAL